MRTLFAIGHHVWNLGHSIETKKYLTGLAKGSNRGWLIQCDCGKQWSR